MLLQALQAAFGTFLLTLAATAAGYPIFRMVGSSFQRWERLALSVLGGWGLLSLALYLIGQIQFSRTIILVVVGVFAAAGVWSLWKIGQEGPWPLPLLERRAWLPAALVILVLAITAVAGLAPVVGDWNSDTVAYHLLGPKVWLRAEIIRPVADNCHTAFPQTAETMYAALMAIGGPSAPCFADFLTFGLLLAMCGSLAMRAGLDPAGAWWVAAMVATMPAVFSGAHRAFVDGLFAAFLIAAIRVGLSANSRAPWAVVGIFGGLLAATKYTGLLALPVLAIGMAFLQGMREGENRAQWQEMVRAGIVAVLIAAPYYVRNWLVLGCPIYPPPPGLAGMCHAKYLTTQAIVDFHHYILQRGAGMGRGPLAFLLLPFNLTYHTANFHGAGGIGLVPLGLAPIGIYATRKNSTTKFLVVIGALLTVAWFLTEQESRFLIQVYAIGAVLGVVGWKEVKKLSGGVGRAVGAVLVSVSVLYGLFMIVKPEIDPMHAVFSPRYAAMRQEREIPYVKSFAYLNHEAAVKEVLILDRSVPPYYLEKNYMKPVGQWGELTVPGVTSSAQALQQLGTLSITHVLDVNSELSGFQVKQPAAGLQLVFEAKDQRIYRVE